MKVIYRFSDKGYPKNKLPSVDNENCLKNFIHNFLDDDLTDLVVIEDNCVDSTIKRVSKILGAPYLKGIPVEIKTDLGNAGSYNYGLDYTISNFSDNEIVYMVEGDFIHDIGSKKVMEEGYNIPGVDVDYVTLYAHPDKELPQSIQPEYIFRSTSTYWRSCVSTVMTCSARVKTLKEDYATIKRWTGGVHPKDHEMYTELRAKGRLLINPIPGYSTHGETAWLSPFKDWNKILGSSIFYYEQYR